MRKVGIHGLTLNPLTIDNRDGVNLSMVDKVITEALDLEYPTIDRMVGNKRDCLDRG